jgi:CDP-ribitol ribitolphosphotransferase
MAQSGTIFLDDHAPVLDWLKLDSDTCVVQLWHAGAGFKSSGYSRWGHMFCPPPQSCHRQYRYGISGSRQIAPFFSEVWGINDELVLPTGMPRMDEYLNEDYRKQKTEELYEQYPMCKGKKVILFAPTYRGNNKGDAYYPYNLLDMEELYRLCGDEYVVLFKMHPWVNVDISIEEKYQDRFASAIQYPNINDLFYITELLITDYSSNIFEYSIMRKPMLFFAFDKVQYSVSRGFHRAYEESAPGKVCYTFAEVLEAIRNQDYKYEKVEQYVEHHFDYIDTHASDRVIDWILLGQMPEEVRKDIETKEAEVKAMQRLDFKTIAKKEMNA